MGYEKQPHHLALSLFSKWHAARSLFGVCLGIMLGGVNPAYALFCHGEVVSEGASKPEVLLKCGDPTFAEQRVIYETIYVYPGGYQAPHSREIPRAMAPSPPAQRRSNTPQGQQSGPRNLAPVYPSAPGPSRLLYPPQPVVITELVEEWIYNFGPHSLMYRLRFADGVLRSITTLNYGY